MPLLQAFGLGVAIIVLKLLTPVLFAEIEETALLFLEGAQVGAEVATDLAASAAYARIENHPLTLPKAQQVRMR